MNLRSPLAPALLASLLLAACGYGWQDEPRIYPPSGAGAGDGPGQVVAGSAVAGPGEHLVQPGDTLYAIGFKNQIDWKDLVSWNSIGGDYLIHPGQIIRLTPPESSASIQTQALPAAPAPIPPPTGGLLGPVAIPADAAPGAIAIASPVAVTATPAAPASNPPAPPVAMPAAGPGQRWSWPSSGALLRRYNLAAGAKGIDIGGELGQPVKATAAGKVVYSGSALKGYGELVIVKHDDSYLSAYGYNRVRLVKEGDAVRAGQTIAELGIGPEQKPALHFEIREHGKPVDPLKFLPAP
ncbi:MAG: peptidoglycan DD-metalloendopeptidase family protein [Stagnimonas sp.]|nr:peptidoglycan DD-metalloendopeptidase family protein [Stagnimonas sp.]